jgi:hypothetical protein
MSSNTFPNPRDSNVHTTVCKIPDREVSILRECYESMGEPQPDGDSTLSHNSAFGDFLRAILRGDVTAEDVTASEPEDVSENTYLPLEISITPEEYAIMDNAGIPTKPPREAFRRNGKIAQCILTLLRNYCNRVVE